jgi:hypothetical protein
MRARLFINLFVAISLFPLSAAAQSQSFATVTASQLYNSSDGKLIQAGTICFSPVDQYTRSISFSLLGGGVVSRAAACANIVNGAITTDVNGGTFQLANTQETSPENVCYNVTAYDTSSGSATVAFGDGSASFNSGYNCVQMNSTWCSTSGNSYSCDFDKVAPSQPTIPISSTLLSINSVTSAPTASATLTSLGSNQWGLNLVLPYGQPPNVSFSLSTLSPGSTPTWGCSGSTPNYNCIVGIPSSGTAVAGGSSGQIQYNNSGQLAGAGIATLGAALTDANGNMSIDGTPLLAGWPLPVGTNSGNNFLAGPQAGQMLYDFAALAPVTANATAGSGATQLTMASAPAYGPGWVANGTGIPANDAVASLSPGNIVNLVLPTTAALSASAVTFTYTPEYTSGLIAIGRFACQFCYTNNGSVVIGTSALANDKGEGGGGEDTNGVFIGPDVAFGETGYDCPYLPTFEPVIIGNKAGGTGCGWRSTRLIGNHIYQITGSLNTNLVGGEIGSTLPGNVWVVPSNFNGYGENLFNPEASTGLSNPPAGTYSVANANVFGNTSALNAMNTHDFNVFGYQSFIGLNGLISGTEDFVGGNYVANNVTSGSADVLIGGGDPLSGSEGATANFLQSANGVSAYGIGAAAHDISASYLTANGYRAAAQATTLVDAFGAMACFGVTTGTGDACFGYSSGYGLGAGSDDFMAGNNAGAYAGSVSFVSDDGYYAGAHDASSDNTYHGYRAGDVPTPTAGENTASGFEVFDGPKTGSEADDAFFGALADCDGCTQSSGLGYDAHVGAVAGAVQLGAGTNGVADSLQFQGWNFLTSSGAASFNTETLSGATPTVGSGSLGLGATISSTASAGTATLPTAPAEFLEVNVAGTMYKIPLYAN